MNTRSASKIPEHWAARILAKCHRIWGDGFTRKWAPLEANDLIDTWREGLAGMNEEALMRGYKALFSMQYPPDLPQFKAACVINPAHQFPAIEHKHSITEDGSASLAKVRAMLKPLSERDEVPANMTGIEWAAKIVREANDTRERIDLLRLAHAQESLKTWCALHHCSLDDLDEDGKWKGGERYAWRRVPDEVELPPRVPSPHIYREPGEDDE